MKPIRLVSILLILLLSSCKTYKQDIMFQLDEDFSAADLSRITSKMARDYLLRPHDVLWLDVFTDKGERLIDPNFELSMNNQAIQQQSVRDIFQYVIQADSMVNFPMIGGINLVGMTLYEAEMAVAKAFEAFYSTPFVKLRTANRRVFVLGVQGGQVIPIPNENTSIIEVLALADGIPFGGRAQNIRLIRGEEVFIVDLSTLSAMSKTNVAVQPGDIVYVEPWRRPALEALRDSGPFVSIVSSVITLIFIIQRF